MICSKNRIIPETESESDDEAIHNETQQTTQQDATSQSDSEKEERNENGSQVGAVRTGQRNRRKLVWNNAPVKVSRPVMPWKVDSTETNRFPEPAISDFRRLVDNSMISDIADQTNLYSTQKDPHKVIDVSTSEIEQFIGTLFTFQFMGYPELKCSGEVKRVFQKFQM